MKRVKRLLSLLMTGLVISLAAGCAQSKQDDKKNTTKVEAAKSVTLTISAAASLKDAMGELEQEYTKEHKNVTLKFNFGSSGALEQQIEQGAPADIFISAATKQMDALKTKGLTSDDTRFNLLGNNIVLVTAKDSSISISDFKSLTDSSVKKLALGEPKSVPAGQYAEDIFTKYGILDKVKTKAVYGNDVKQVLSWVESGNADAGVVYESDAKTSTKVKILATAPADSHKPVVYPAAVLKDSKNAEDAKAFLDFLKSDTAKTIFEKYSFIFMPK